MAPNTRHCYENYKRQDITHVLWCQYRGNTPKNEGIVIFFSSISPRNCKRWLFSVFIFFVLTLRSQLLYKVLTCIGFVVLTSLITPPSSQANDAQSLSWPSLPPPLLHFLGKILKTQVFLLSPSYFEFSIRILSHFHGLLNRVLNLHYFPKI